MFYPDFRILQFFSLPVVTSLFPDLIMQSLRLNLTALSAGLLCKLHRPLCYIVSFSKGSGVTI